MIDDDTATLYAQLVRSGVCPVCNGKLEPPRLPRTYAMPPTGGWTGWRERTCYDCAETFGYYLQEPA